MPTSSAATLDATAAIGWKDRPPNERALEGQLLADILFDRGVAMGREQWGDDLDWSYEKHAAWVIYGPPVAPELAGEILRRTDSIFMSEGASTPYKRNIQRLLGVPRPDDFDASREMAADGYFAALRRYVTTWGLLGAGHDQWMPAPMLLQNDIVGAGRGWCYPDGTIAMAGEVERGYPDSILAECEMLAHAFPELTMSIAYWGSHEVDAPTMGFKVADGRAVPTRGDDSTLFGEFGRLMYWSTISSAAEKAAQKASSGLTTTSRFGDRSDGDAGPASPGVPDDVIDVWLDKARSLGLAR